ncbi:HAMP domain-containing sensor histidine kinase [Anaerospora sp.]|jgi:signal transduction histidine kinase|uniref:sensor histidine kinase n=1 Tax=Anaerospora sp. TaxID=1960278 RepID=UPI002897E2DB|nr:HAMP domain-containing sensor histidine kinase [Anaerospora sp.]MDF2572359.1 integral rane sensor signal transduction histidine kinase [Sporomusa sp.]
MIVRSLLFRQLFSHVAIILFMALTLLISVVYYAHQNNNGDLTLKLRNIAAFFSEDLKTGHISDREWEIVSRTTGAVMWLEDHNGRIIQGNPPVYSNVEPYTLRNSVEYSKQFLFLSEAQNAVIISVPVLIKDEPGRLFAFYHFSPLHIKMIIRSYLFPFIAGLTAAFLLAILLSRRLTRSIADIAAAAKRFSAGDYTSRTRATEKDEIGTLGNTFNAMADAIFHTQQTSRAFFSNISHELKTPLSSVKATTEALIDGIAVNEQERTHYLERILAETDRMSRLVHDIMDMELLESDQMFIKQERLDIATLLLHQAAKIEPLLKKKTISLRLRIEANKRYALGDADRFEQVLDNLLSNAIRHAPSGSQISLILTEELQWFHVSVADQGEGIANEDLPLIWDRFYRADKSRTRSLGGSGLGLSISRGLIEAMGGTISVESEKGKGTIFKIRIPWQK